MLCDSNILIYAADPEDIFCRAFVEREDAVIASVTRIEVLGFVGFGKLSDERRTRLIEIVASMMELELNENVIQRCIALRQQKKMSLADAIIAATALLHGLPLVTRNVDDFKHIAALKLLNPFPDS
jgi:predicted nucleic acid-binding protein